MLKNILDQNSHHSDKENVNGAFNEICILNSNKRMIANSIASNNINPFVRSPR